MTEVLLRKGAAEAEWEVVVDDAVTSWPDEAFAALFALSTAYKFGSGKVELGEGASVESLARGRQLAQVLALHD